MQSVTRQAHPPLTKGAHCIDDGMVWLGFSFKSHRKGVGGIVELHVGDLLSGASKASSALNSFPLRRMEIVKCASKACCKLPGNEKHLGALGFKSFQKRSISIVSPFKSIVAKWGYHKMISNFTIKSLFGILLIKSPRHLKKNFNLSKIIWQKN